MVGVARQQCINGFKHTQAHYYKWRDLFGMTSAQSQRFPVLYP